MDYWYYVEEFILTIMDALEELMETITVPAGKKVTEVLFVLLGFLGFSLFCKLFELPTFVSWVEALTACIIMGIILLINNINASGIEATKNKIMRIGGRKNG